LHREINSPFGKLGNIEQAASVNYYENARILRIFVVDTDDTTGKKRKVSVV